MIQPALVWFRRDLRDFDHAALSAALAEERRVHCAFVFDTEILDALPRRDDPRVTFIWESVRELAGRLRERGGGLHVLHGRAREAIPRLAASLGVQAVYANRDYEPQAMERDAEVEQRLGANGIELLTFKDQVVFEAHEVTTSQGRGFAVFTPYKRAWLLNLDAATLAGHPEGPGRFAPADDSLPPLQSLGFRPIEPVLAAGMSGAAAAWQAFKPRMRTYHERRDFPALEGTSRLSVHLRFGTISVRALAAEAWKRGGPGPKAWLSELAWRDFYFAILAMRPDVVEHAFHRRYDALSWDGSEAGWNAWREGRTGYPLVDAAMRELLMQGTMHNRLRMVVASFLAKHLAIDWRRGERHFASLLLDYDLAANNGGWQWSASTGCDAQPWFRIFNPILQSRRFDPEGQYIRRWVPELASVPAASIHAPWEMGPLEQAAAGCVVGRDYPSPVVDHETARRHALARYAAARR